MRVLVTGVSGFVARHVAKQLLEAGHHVRGTVRSLPRSGSVRDTMPPDTLERLTFVELDLTADDGWDAAVRGVDAIMHIASPFPMNQAVADPDVLVRPAVGGTLRVMETAQRAGIERVILTSSVVAVENGPHPEGRPYDERDWSMADHPNFQANAYVRSKTEAERAAWAFAGEHGINLTTICPGLILGPPLGRDWGTSLKLVERLLSGKDPMLPPLTFSVVDVRDVAKAHLAALDDPTTSGERFILSAGSVSFADIARIAKRYVPKRKIATRTAPPMLIKAMALFDPALKGIVPILGRERELSGAKARKVLGIEYISVEEAVRTSVEAVEAAGA